MLSLYIVNLLIYIALDGEWSAHPLFKAPTFINQETEHKMHIHSLKFLYIHALTDRA